MNEGREALHRRTWELIPWVVNGRAPTEARDEVEHHVADCADCQAELELQQQIHAALRSATDGDAADALPALARLWERIDATPEQPGSPRRLPPWLGLAAAVVLVETIAIAALAAALWLREHPAAEYRTLASAPTRPGPATVRAVFAPSLSQEATQALLRSAGLQIVDGPSEAGVYSLAPTSGTGSAAAALALLRADPGVRFAEPLANGAPP